MVTRFRGRLAVVVAGVAASFVFMGTPASAQGMPIVVVTTPPPYLHTQRVAYWDLNLATRAGAETLHRRVGQAVENVCLYDQGRWYGLAEPKFNQCTAGAWRRARPQMIGAVYRARQAAYYRGY